MTRLSDIVQHAWSERSVAVMELHRRLDQACSSTGGIPQPERRELIAALVALSRIGEAREHAAWLNALCARRAG